MRYFLSTLLFIVASQVAAVDYATGKAANNDLYKHPSPYLAMHGRDPVRWHEWNAATVAKAKQQNKLLFVSSGYFSCHWCHVMQRESYQNQKIADLLNKHFIPVKVDRELDAALDTRLTDFVDKTLGYSGWPLNAFVTPEGYPLIGMVYVPAEKFTTILSRLAEEWQGDPAGLRNMAQAATSELTPAVIASDSNVNFKITDKLISKFQQQSLSIADDIQGGFGNPNKFPYAPQLSALLQIYAKNKDPDLKKYLELTLNHMARLGLRDQLGGGFFRYVVDPGWQVPHFEKMLYDNALLARVYLQAGRILQREDYLAIARDTLDFMLRELRTAKGTFAASLSAVDDKGIEGGYYLWHEVDLKNLLSAEEFKVASAFWQIYGAPELDDGHHLLEVGDISDIAKQNKLKPQQVVKYIESARKKMLAARSARILPKDNKALAGWNGLALTAFVEAAEEFNSVEYRDAAKKLVNYIRTVLWDGKQLHRAVENGKSLGSAQLDDYAYIIEGLYTWLRHTKGDGEQRLLLQLMDIAWQKFYNQHGWLLAENMLLKYGAGQTLLADNVLPSASALMIRLTLQIHAEPRHALQQKALRAMNVAYDELLLEPFWHASQIVNFMSLARH